MIKMGRTKYGTALGNLSAPDIITKLGKARQTKRNRSIGYKTIHQGQVCRYGRPALLLQER